MLSLFLSLAAADPSLYTFDPLLDPVHNDLLTEFSTMQHCEDSTLHPLRAGPGENGRYNATRVDFRARPYEADEVSYLLHEGTFAGTTCDPTVVHDLVLFVGPSGAPPPATPVELARITMSGSVSSWAHPAAGTLHLFEAVVPGGLRIDAGEDLWVAVEMRVDASGERVCLAQCAKQESGGIFSSYWSDGVSTPYPWKSLEFFGIDEDALYYVDGRM